MLVVGLLLLFAVVIVVSIARLAALLPQYADHSDDLMQSLAASLQQFGVEPGQLKEAVSSIDPAKLVALIGAFLAGLSGVVSSLVFLLCLLLFLSVEAGGMDQRLAAVARSTGRTSSGRCARSPTEPAPTWSSPLSSGSSWASSTPARSRSSGSRSRCCGGC